MEETNQGKIVSNGEANGSGAKIKESDTPKFELEKVQLQFGLASSLRRVLVENNIVYLILVSNVFKINLNSPSIVKEYQLGNNNGEILDSWVHPSGAHLILRASDGNYYYLHDTYKEFIPLARFKNIEVSGMTFLRSSNSPGTTDPFFVYTTDGLIYLSIINVSDIDKNRKDKKQLKLLYKAKSMILGLYLSNNETQISIVTETEILLFDCFDMTYGELSKVFKNPSSVTKTSIKGLEQTIFASNGKCFILINNKSKEFYTNDAELELSKVRKLSSKYGDFLRSNNSIAITEHHLLLLSANRLSLIIFNKLNCSEPTILNLSKFMQQGEHIIGITADYSSSTYWMYSESNLYELVISNESISAWYNYYKLGKFEEALKCIPSDSKSNKLKREMVIMKQGYSLLQEGGFGLKALDVINHDLLELQVKGIKLLAELAEPFEKVCLMIMNIGDSSHKYDNRSYDDYVLNRLLIEFLLVKLSTCKSTDHNYIKITILSTWIVVLIVRVLYKLEHELSHKIESGDSDKTEERMKSILRLSKNMLRMYEEFLARNYKVLNEEVVYQLVGEIGCSAQLLPYTNLIKDYDFILTYYIDIEDWSNALRTVEKIWDDSDLTHRDLIYKNSTILLIKCPRLTIETWLKLKSLDYRRLLLAILSYNKNNIDVPVSKNYSLIFMLRLIYEKGLQDSIIINCYLSVLITYPCQDEHNFSITEKLITRVLHKFKGAKSGDGYDAQFILSLCLEHRFYKPAVIILIHDLKMFEDGLILALENDMTLLAELVLKEYDRYVLNDEGFDADYNESDHPEKADSKDEDNVRQIKLESDSFSSRKKLWMIYAKFIIDGVFQGKDLEVLDLESDDFSSLKDDSSDKDEKQSAADEIVSSSLDNDKVKVSLAKLNKAMYLTKLHGALKYLFRLSQTGHSSRIISLKDFLPLFPERIMLNDLKDEIVNSLNQYNLKISQLTMEMQESLSATQNLKYQIKESKNVSNMSKIYTIIEPGESCKLCKNLLVDKNFLAFPNCHHNFHKDCLLRYYLKEKNDSRFNMMLKNFKSNSSVKNKEELENILLRECVLCNEENINGIDVPLISNKKDSEKLQFWSLN